MDNIQSIIEKITLLNPMTQNKIISSAIAIFIIWILKLIILKIVWKNTDNIKVRYSWRKVTSYSMIIIMIFVLVKIWFKGFDNLATFFGLLAGGIAITLRDILASIAAWMFIIIKKPINLGDRIEIGKITGDIVDIRLIQFTIMETGNWVDADQSTGRIIHIPNHLILTEHLANYSRGFHYIWNEINILLTFESDWKEAKQLFRALLDDLSDLQPSIARNNVKEASKKYLIYYNKLTPIVYTTVKSDGIQLSLRYLCEPRKRRNSENNIWENILDIVENNENINFAYNTSRIILDNDS